MEYVNLGRTGLKVSRLCLGCMSFGAKSWREWVLTEDEARPFIKKAWDAGINFFDTANMYSLGVSEEILGRAVRDFMKRDEVVIATKVYFPMEDRPNRGGLSRKHILAECDASLKRLGVDYIDLYQIHRLDPTTILDETLSALNDLVRAGKVRYIGASSMWAWQFAEALNISKRNGWARFETMQNHYNLIYREEEREMIPLCRFKGVGMIPWSPLARGLLTGTRTRDNQELTLRAKTDDYTRQIYVVDSDFDIIDRLAAMAKERNVHPASLALAWLLHKPGVVAPIFGATKPVHLEDALVALSIKLTGDEMLRLEELYAPHRVTGHR